LALNPIAGAVPSDSAQQPTVSQPDDHAGARGRRAANIGCVIRARGEHQPFLVLNVQISRVALI
jgi:hypothetical protein